MAKNIIRKEILNFQPYIPGKPIDEVKRELGLKKVIKLASNENSLGVSKKVIGELIKSATEIYRYPDGSSYILRRKIAKKCGVRENMVIVGAGSDELIELIGKVFFNAKDEIIVSSHAFIRYKMAADMLGAKVVTIPMKNMRHDLDGMLKAVNKNTKAVFVANPNNPTGTYNTKIDVNNFIKKLLKTSHRPLVVFDQAYYEYAEQVKDYPKMIEYLDVYKNLVILRTFSKIYSLAGLRVGYALASDGIVAYLDRLRPPFNVSLIAQKAAEVALDDKQHLKKSLELFSEGKKYLYKEFDKSNIKYIPSIANFILVDVSPRLGMDVFRDLLKRGIIVRAMDEYEFPNHIRVTIGKPEENRKFVKDLRKVLSGC